MGSKQNLRHPKDNNNLSACTKKHKYNQKHLTSTLENSRANTLKNKEELSNTTAFLSCLNPKIESGFKHQYPTTADLKKKKTFFQKEYNQKHLSHININNKTIDSPSTVLWKKMKSPSIYSRQFFGKNEVTIDSKSIALKKKTKSPSPSIPFWEKMKSPPIHRRSFFGNKQSKKKKKRVKFCSNADF